MNSLDRNLILIGVKHSGKTTLGRAFADKYGLPFIDLDKKILDLYNIDSEHTIWEIFNKVGRSVFMELENQAIKEIMKHKMEETMVLALGGGTVENVEAVALLKGFGDYVFLDELPDVMYRRVMKEGRPAFLSEEKPWEDFMEIYQRRRNICLALADITIKPIPNAIDISIEKLENRIKERADGR